GVAELDATAFLGRDGLDALPANLFALRRLVGLRRRRSVGARLLWLRLPAGRLFARLPRAVAATATLLGAVENGRAALRLCLLTGLGLLLARLPRFGLVLCGRLLRLRLTWRGR